MGPSAGRGRRPRRHALTVLRDVCPGGLAAGRARRRAGQRRGQGERNGELWSGAHCDTPETVHRGRHRMVRGWPRLPHHQRARHRSRPPCAAVGRVRPEAEGSRGRLCGPRAEGTRARARPAARPRGRVAPRGSPRRGCAHDDGACQRAAVQWRESRGPSREVQRADHARRNGQSAQGFRARSGPAQDPGRDVPGSVDHGQGAEGRGRCPHPGLPGSRQESRAPQPERLERSLRHEGPGVGIQHGCHRPGRDPDGRFRRPWKQRRARGGRQWSPSSAS